MGKLKDEIHADEVNIAFQMGAEWQRDQSKARIEQVEAELIRTHRLMMAEAKEVERLEAEKAAWKGIHEGAVLSLQERIKQLEAALRKIAAIEDEHINIPKTNEGANLWACLAMCVELAEVALEGKKDE